MSGGLSHVGKTAKYKKLHGKKMEIYTRVLSHSPFPVAYKRGWTDICSLTLTLTKKSQVRKCRPSLKPLKPCVVHGNAKVTAETTLVWVMAKESPTSSTSSVFLRRRFTVGFNLFDTADLQICKLSNQVGAQQDVVMITH